MGSNSSSTQFGMGQVGPDCARRTLRTLRLGFSERPARAASKSVAEDSDRPRMLAAGNGQARPYWGGPGPTEGLKGGEIEGSPLVFNRLTFRARGRKDLRRTLWFSVLTGASPEANDPVAAGARSRSKFWRGPGLRRGAGSSTAAGEAGRIALTALRPASHYAPARRGSRLASDCDGSEQAKQIA